MIYKKNILLFIIVTLFFNFNTIAQDKHVSLPWETGPLVGPIPSVWAWKISNKNRTVYLMGELHNFFAFEKRLLIDHKLGQEIYNKVAEVWVEPMQKKPPMLTNPPITDRIPISTWNETTKLVKDLMGKIAKNNSDKLAREYIENIQYSDPMAAYVQLSGLGTLAAQYFNMFKIRSYRGFSGILNTSPYSLTSYKQIWIESETSVADAWYKYCDTSENANVLIESSLPYLKFPYFYESDLYAKSQDFFTSSHSNIDDFARVGEAFPEYKIINDCVIIPRNLLWLPHFIKTLDSSGPPIAYLVGIGHIGGDQGLLSLLRKQGYADIKRIYSLE